MEKTKLGISVGLFGAMICFVGVFSGFTAMLLLTGYVMLCEQNKWLRKLSVKAVWIMILVSFLITIANFVPNVFGVLDSIFRMIGLRFQITFITSFFKAVSSAVELLGDLVLLLLGLASINQGCIPIPLVDDLIKMHMD